MKFWDTSALVPLVLAEDTSRTMRQLLMSDVNVVVSFITPVELQSVIVRRLKAHESETRQVALEFISGLDNVWTIADDYQQIISRARRLASVHALRSADAIQLGSAMSLRRGGLQMEFVTGDEELRAAASAEGFAVLP